MPGFSYIGWLENAMGREETDGKGGMRYVNDILPFTTYRRAEDCVTVIEWDDGLPEEGVSPPR